MEQGADWQEMEVEPEYKPRFRPRNYSEGSNYFIDNLSFSPKISNPGELVGMVQLPKTNSFDEKFELEDFPFDVQTCHVFLSFMNFYNETDEDGINTTKQYHDRFLIPAEGFVHQANEMAEWYLLRPGLRLVNKEAKNPLAVFEFNVMRKYHWYLYNFIILTGVIASLALASYAYEVVDYEKRTSITFTIVLTLVAQKFALSGEVPKAPSLSFLDKSIFSCFMLVTSVIVQ